jgi:hypothetical protein
MPLYGTGYIFSKKFFTGWVIVSIIWIFCTFIAIVIYPLWESRTTLGKVLRMMLGFKSKSPPVVEGEPAASGTATPTTTKEGMTGVMKAEEKMDEDKI